MSKLSFNYVPALPNPDWNDPLYFYILADAEEERGNQLASSTLRFIAKARLKPHKTHTMRINMSGKVDHIVSYDWRCEPEARNICERYCIIPQAIVIELPPLDDIPYDRYRTTPEEEVSWAAYWTIEDAYMALIDTCIRMKVEMIQNPEEDEISLIYHPYITYV